MKEISSSRRLVLAGLAASTLLPSICGAEEQRPTPKGYFGVNCFDLFYGLLISPSRTASSRARLRELRMLGGIPFVRFSCSPVWPAEWNIYLRDRAKYFGILDQVIGAAESQQVKLVPSLIWSAPNISDLVGEPVSDWGRSGSKTREFMQRYVSEVIERYKGSSAILMWEFGNEFTGYADLPNALRWWPRVSVEQGTPRARSARDLIRARDCAEAFAHFGKEARRLDPTRPLTTGISLPLPNASNLAAGSWELDTPAQFRDALRLQTPDPLDVISIHLYPYALQKRFKGRSASYQDVLDEVNSVARSTNKRVFVGEFGVPKMSNHEAEKREFRNMLDALIQARPDWAALWVYDFWGQEGEWNVSFKNERSYQLEWLIQANRQA
jgi:hypothetical protein